MNDYGSGHYFRHGDTTVRLAFCRLYANVKGPPSEKDVFTERLHGIFLEQD